MQCGRPAAAAAVLVCLLALVGRSAAQVLTPQQTSLLLLKVREPGVLLRFQRCAGVAHCNWLLTQPHLRLKIAGACVCHCL